jgi:hypothetical protein
MSIFNLRDNAINDRHQYAIKELFKNLGDGKPPVTFGRYKGPRGKVR